MNKTLLSIKGVFSKEDNSEITEEEQDDLIDAILEVVENKGFMFGGGFKLKKDK